MRDCVIQFLLPKPTESQQLTYFCNGANFLISSRTFLVIFCFFRKIPTTFYAKNIRFLFEYQEIPSYGAGGVVSVVRMIHYNNITGKYAGKQMAIFVMISQNYC